MESGRGCRLAGVWHWDGLESGWARVADMSHVVCGVFLSTHIVGFLNFPWPVGAETR